MNPYGLAGWRRVENWFEIALAIVQMVVLLSLFDFLFLPPRFRFFFISLPFHCLTHSGRHGDQMATWLAGLHRSLFHFFFFMCRADGYRGRCFIEVGRPKNATSSCRTKREPSHPTSAFLTTKPGKWHHLAFHYENCHHLSNPLPFKSWLRSVCWPIMGWTLFSRTQSGPLWSLDDNRGFGWPVSNASSDRYSR